MESTKFDVLIIGAGPAGLSAALWANELHLSSRVLEASDQAGGQLLKTFNRIDNHLGVSCKNGEELRDRFIATLSPKNIQIHYGSEVSEIRAGERSVFLKDGKELSYRALLISTGVRRRKLGIPGEIEFRGKGVLYSGKRDAWKSAGKTAIVVGGGDAAFENALILAQHASKVVLIHRRREFTARDEFVNKVRAAASIEVVTDAELKAIEGSKHVENVTLSMKNDGERKLEAGVVVIRVGVEANSHVAVGVLDIDDNGYIEIGRDCSTSRQGIYAAGDVANPLSPTISSAVGMGATALKSIEEFLRSKLD